MSGKCVSFCDKRIKKSDFYQNKKLFQTDDTEINKVLVSKKGPYGTKKVQQFHYDCFIEFH